MIKNKGTLLAYVLLVIRSMIYGSSILFVGRLLETTEVFDVLALRFLISAATLLILWAIRIIHIDLKGKNLKILLATSIFEPVGYFIFETPGIGGTSATVAGILAASTPILVVILETVFLREKTNVAQSFFLLLSILGVLTVALLSGNSDNTNNTVIGMIFLFAAHLSGALFLVCSRKSSSRFSSMEITFFTTMVGAVVFNVINVIRHLTMGTITEYFKPLMNTENLVGLLFLSILSSIVATAMGNYGLSRIQASSVSSLSGIATITTVVLGVVVNGDKLRWYHILGAVMILTGGIGINRITQKKKAKLESHIQGV